MKHSITFSLSPAAQRALARAGQPAAKDQSLALPQNLMARALDLGASVASDGSVTLVASEAVRAAYCERAGDLRYRRGCPDELVLLEALPTSASEVLDAIAVQRHCAENAADALIAETVATARESLSTQVDEAGREGGGADLWRNDAERLAARARLSSEDTARHVAAVLSAVAQRNAREAADEAAHVAAVEALLCSWEQNHDLARAAGLPRSGKLKATPIFHGDGYLCPGPLKPRLAALYEAIETEDRQREERVEHEARAWAREHGRSALGSAELQRAAGEGRAVLSEIQSLVLSRLGEGIENCCESVGWYIGPDWYDDEVREGVPSSEAYQLFDRLTASRQQLADAHGLPGGVETIEIGPISRFDVAKRGAAVWRTGVGVTLRHPWMGEPMTLVVLAEPIIQAQEDESDDDE